MQRAFGYARILATALPAVNATVEVFDAGTANVSTIYDDNLAPPTARANPFTADANGFFFFYAANGRYDVRLSGGGIVAPYTWGDILLEDLVWVRELRTGLYLGGSLQLGVRFATVVDVIDPVDVQIDGDAVPNTVQARVIVRTYNAATSVTPRVRNITDGVTAGTGAASASVTNAAQSFAVTLAAGVKEYRLQLTPSNDTHPVFGLGYLQFYEV